MRRRVPILATFLLTAFAFTPGGQAEDDMMKGGAPGQGGMGQPGMGHMGEMGSQGMHGGAQTDPMSDMSRRMQELREHSHLMEGIEDPGRLRDEMRRHMKMMDDMMQAMMEHEHGSSPGSAPSQAPSQGMSGDM
jgi:hypothetical protein